MSQDLVWLDAVAQADLIRRKEVQPIDLVDAAIARIEALNPTINAVVAPLYDQARAAARSPLPDGPFTGVPFLLKDLLAAQAGVPMTSGSALLRHYVPATDSELVARFKRAGLVILGKTNTPEFGLLPTTEPKLFGPTRNPWNPERTTGGSSGGSAAAVAAGFVPMAHANDGGGSIRIPASCCGLFGMKPTRARNSLAPFFGDLFGGLVVEHAVTRSVRDSAALLDATAGYAPGDPYCAPPPDRPYTEEVTLPPRKLRIAVPFELPPGISVHPDCITAVGETATLCAELGHELVYDFPKLDPERLTHAFIGLWAAGCAWQLDLIAHESGQSPSPEQVEPLTWKLYEIGKKLPASDYLLAVTYLQSVGREIARFFQTCDVVLTPTLAEPPVPLGTFDFPEDQLEAAVARANAFAPFTPFCNATGQPAMSVPLYWNSEGLPIGSHFIGRYGDEGTLFRLAAQFEAARPWADRRPPLAAV